MKRAKILTVVIIVALLTVSLFAFTSSPILAIGEGWVSLNGAAQDAPAEMKATSSDESGMSATFALNGFYVEDVTLEGQVWQRITFPNQGYLGQVGAPNVPVMRRMFAIPATTGLEVVVTNIAYDKFEDIRLEPAQRLLLETENPADYGFEQDEALYNTDAFFPENWADVSVEGIMHGVRLGSVEVHPFRYNPVQGVLQIARTIDFKVKFTGQERSNALAYETQSIPPHLAKPLENLLLNYKFLGYEFTEERNTLAASVDYLILADPDLVNASSLQDLVNFHTNQGRTVELKNVSTVGSTADQIKSYIQSVYDSVNPPDLDYVLLVADVSVIPFKSSAHSGNDSDIWYAWLDGNDIFGDVGLGRFPARNVTELNYMVSKTLDFHNNAYPGSWQDKVTLVAHNQDYPGKYTACKESIYDHNYTLTPPTFDKIYGGAGGTNADVDNAIESGRVLVNYRGHGSTTSWSGWDSGGNSYTASMARQLQNGHETPIIFSIACLNLDMNSSSETIGEAFMRHDEGAVAYLGAIHPSYTTPNHDFDRFLFYGTWDEGIEAIGDLLNWANVELYDMYGSGYVEENITMYLWLGDPSLQIRGGGGPGPTPTPTRTPTRTPTSPPPPTNTPTRTPTGVPPTPTPTSPPGNVVFFDDFETSQAWVVDPNSNDTATTGLWERANPEGTSYSGVNYQLGTTVSGSYDLVTEGSAGSSVGTYDIDGGDTTIRSPDITLPSSGDVTLSFSYYLAHYNNGASDDYLRVKVVGSTTQTVFEELASGDYDEAVWDTFSTSLNSFRGQTVYLLIEAADGGSGSLIEAAVDDVLVESSEVPPPTPTPTTVPPTPTPTGVPPTPTPTSGPGIIFFDDFESSQGWVVDPNNNDTATTGLWERANPESTSYSGVTYQLGTTVSGSYDLVTEGSAGSSVGTYDIDGGDTTIRSPNITLPGSGNITLSFSYYLAHYSNGASDDYLRVKVVGSTTQTVFEELGAGNTDAAVWDTFSTSLNSFRGQTVYLLIEAADGGSGSLIEAAVDDVRIESN